MRELQAAFARLLLAIDGSAFYHAGAYYANSDDAARRRRETARLLLSMTDVRRAQRLEVLEARAKGETSCVWCDRPVAYDAPALVLAGQLLHQSDACAGEYERWTSAQIHLTLLGRMALIPLSLEVSHVAL